MIWETINKMSPNFLLGLMFTLGFVAGFIFATLFNSKATIIYKQPDLFTEQSVVLNNCMAGYDRTLKLLGEANVLLESLTR